MVQGLLVGVCRGRGCSSKTSSVERPWQCYPGSEMAPGPADPTAPHDALGRGPVHCVGCNDRDVERSPVRKRDGRYRWLLYRYTSDADCAGRALGKQPCRPHADRSDLGLVPIDLLPSGQPVLLHRRPELGKVMPIKIYGSVVGILSRHGTMKISANVVRVDPKTSAFQQPIEAEVTMRYSPGDAGQPCRTPDSKWKNGETNPLGCCRTGSLTRTMSSNRQVPPTSGAERSWRPGRKPC